MMNTGQQMTCPCGKHRWIPTLRAWGTMSASGLAITRFTDNDAPPCAGGAPTKPTHRVPTRPPFTVKR